MDWKRIVAVLCQSDFVTNRQSERSEIEDYFAKVSNH